MDPTADALIARLRRNPDDVEAFASLRAHYHRRRDYASLVNLLEGWAARARDLAAAADAFHEAGDLCLSYLGDRSRSISLLERALERNPVHIEASLFLERLFTEVHDERRRLEVLERRAEAMTAAQMDPRLIAAVHLQLGEIWEQQHKRTDRAIYHYRKGFELDPTLVPAIYAAREIYRTAGNLKAAASLYDMEANAEFDPTRKIALLRELAHLRAEELGDFEGATVALQRAMAQAPGDLAVMHDLSMALLRRADQQPEPAASSDRRRAADLLYEMAQRCPADHAIAYAEAALDGCPDHDGSLELLEVLARDHNAQDRLPLRWVAYLHAAPDSPIAGNLRRRLGSAYVDAGQIDDAIVCFEPLLEVGDAEAAEALVALYREAGRERDVTRALSVAIAGLPAEQRVPRLREIIEILVAQGNLDDAASRAMEILQVEPADPEALGFLDEHCRTRGHFGDLRELLLAAARVSTLPVAARKQRLLEVASLSETKMNDADGAISAYRAIAALDPADTGAQVALYELLERHQRWDDLVQVLDRYALTVTDVDEKSRVYRHLAETHRHHRGDLMSAIEALRHLRDLQPGDPAARDALCDALLEANAFLEALPLLRERIAEATNSKESLPLLRVLARALEHDLDDDEGAFATWARILDVESGDLEALDAMERIDTRGMRADRLLQTLAYRAELVEGADRARVYTRMGGIADQQLHDLDRAGEYFAKGLELAPDSAETLDALCDVYDRGERYRDLVVLLRRRAKEESDERARAELYRRIARILQDRVRNEEAAAEAYREVLTAGEDIEALRFIRQRLGNERQWAELEDILRRLSALVEDREERRDLLLERATLLAGELDRKKHAIKILQEIVDQLDAGHTPALGKLAELCEETGDHQGLADALERQLECTRDDGLRVPIAARLADIYDTTVKDTARAIAALYAWSDADPTDPDPKRRLLPHLEKTARWDDMLRVLDSLSEIEEDDAAAGAHAIRAAELAMDQLGDVDGAWDRLTRGVERGDAAAEAALRALADKTYRGGQLAELYVHLAQGADSSEEQARRWQDAAMAYIDRTDDAERALEAMLRALALNMDDREALGRVDDLAVRAKSFQRLDQVYDKLVRTASGDEAKARLLERHARILDEHAGDPSTALDQLLRACALLPQDEELLERAESLAPAANRVDELLVLYDRRRAQAATDEDRAEALLRAALLADRDLADRTRAFHYLAQAVALSLRTAELIPAIESAVAAMDAARPELGDAAALEGLIELYRRLAEEAEEDPEAGAELLARAAHLLDRDLRDPERAFETLKRATTFAPQRRSLLDDMEEFAEQHGWLDGLDTHLAHLVEEALDSDTAVELLRRRGQLLEVELERYSEAAEVWGRLMTVRPTDLSAGRRLRACLRNAGRFQDLLLALERELERTDDPHRSVELLKDVAKCWETELRNRWEALDAWNKVLEHAPDDEEALEARDRLKQSTRRLSSDEEALLGDIEEEGVHEELGADPLFDHGFGGEADDDRPEAAAISVDSADLESYDSEPLEPEAPFGVGGAMVGPPPTHGRHLERVLPGDEVEDEDTHTGEAGAAVVDALVDVGRHSGDVTDPSVETPLEEVYPSPLSGQTNEHESELAAANAEPAAEPDFEVFSPADTAAPHEHSVPAPRQDSFADDFMNVGEDSDVLDISGLMALDDSHEFEAFELADAASIEVEAPEVVGAHHGGFAPQGEDSSSERLFDDDLEVIEGADDRPPPRSPPPPPGDGRTSRPPPLPPLAEEAKPAPSSLPPRRRKRR